MRIRSPKDFWAGLIFVAIGGGFILLAQPISARHHASHGAGYVPDPGRRAARRCSALILALRSFVLDGERVPRFYARPIGVSLVAIVAVRRGAAMARARSRRSPRWSWSAPCRARRAARWRISRWRPSWCCSRSRSSSGCSGCRCRSGRTSEARMETLANLAFGLGVALELAEHRLLLHRLLPRHAGRRAARHRPGGDGGDAAAVHLQARAGAGADHARRHLLRRPVRRLDHRDPGQHSRRVVVGRHHPRRPPDGAPRPRRSCARHRRDRLVHRRLHRDLGGRLFRPAARRDRAASSGRPTISR